METKKATHCSVHIEQGLAVRAFEFEPLYVHELIAWAGYTEPESTEIQKTG